MSPVWSEPFTIHTYEVDAHGQVSIQSVCSYLQEAAGRNAHELGVTVPQLMQHGLTWVLSRLLVRMYAYPQWWEKLVIETWPSGFRRLFALREWRIFHGDELVGEATSAWLMVELEGRRPVRPERHGTWASRIHPERAIPRTLEKLPGAEQPSEGGAVQQTEFRVRFRDLDMNGHANNISYIDWSLECLPRELREGFTVAELELNFLAEVGVGDQIRSRAVARDDGDSGSGRVFDHSLIRGSDGQTAARVRSRWVPRG